MKEGKCESPTDETIRYFQQNFQLHFCNPGINCGNSNWIIKVFAVQTFSVLTSSRSRSRMMRKDETVMTVPWLYTHSLYLVMGVVVR